MRLLPDVLPWTKVFTEEHLCCDGSWQLATQPFSEFYEEVVRDFSENMPGLWRVTISRLRYGYAFWEALGFRNPVVKTTALVWHDRVGVFPDAEGLFRMSRTQTFELGPETVRSIEETGRLPGLRKNRLGVMMENLDAGKAVTGVAADNLDTGGRA